MNIVTEVVVMAGRVAETAQDLAEAAEEGLNTEAAVVPVEAFDFVAGLEPAQL